MKTKMKKNILLFTPIVLLGIFTIFYVIYQDYHQGLKEEKMKYNVSIQGDIYAMVLDGVTINTIPTTNVYLVSYNCENGSNVTWDRVNKKLSISKNIQVTEQCSLEFKKNPLLSEMKQGDYVSYVGNNGCMNGGTPVTGNSDAESGNSCLGNNANETLDTNGNTFGYCNNDRYKYYVKGWRIAYIEDDRSYLISAGSPECNKRTSSTANATYISEANTKALKYCNSSYVDGNCSDNSDTWAIGDIDFNKMTAQMTNSTGGYLYTSISGATNCGRNFSTEECGYNNDLIDNGGDYWFAATYSDTSTYGVYWYSFNRIVDGKSSTSAYGLRPIIRLKSSIYVTGGSGTMDDPYTIGY